MKRFAVIGLTLSVLGGAGQASADTPPLSEQIAAIVQPQLDSHPDLNLGVAVDVVQPGTSGAVNTSIFYFGKLVDQNNNPIPLDGATEFEIGSVTKTFTTTVLAAQFQYQPSLLDLPINQIFRRTPTYKGQQITLRDLADYTSGLPGSNRGQGSASCTFDGAQIEDCYDLHLMFQHLSNPTFTTLQFAPGTRYLYSDLAVAVLALAEPSLSGSQTTKPLQLLSEWEGLVGSVLLQPLRMKSTHAFDPALDPPLLPKGYHKDPSGNISPALSHNTSWPAFIGAGGIVSTPNDMMLYLEYNAGVLEIALNSLLPALRKPYTDVTTPSGEQLGLGWFISPLPGSTIQYLSKNGGVPAFSARIYFAPATATGVVVLTNSSHEKDTDPIVDIGTVALQVLQIINGLTPTATGQTDDQD